MRTGSCVYHRIQKIPPHELLFRTVYHRPVLRLNRRPLRVLVLQQVLLPQFAVDTIMNAIQPVFERRNLARHRIHGVIITQGCATEFTRKHIWQKRKEFVQSNRIQRVLGKSHQVEQFPPTRPPKPCIHSYIIVRL